MPPRVLIVEDEVDVLDIIAEYLAALGYDVRPVASGQDALDLLDGVEVPFDVAIVDWTLPGVSGREVLTRLVSLQPDCARLVTTGHGPDVVSDAVAGSFAATILRKPFTMRSLAVRVEGMVPGGRSEL